MLGTVDVDARACNFSYASDFFFKLTLLALYNEKKKSNNFI